jgi:hypothetical protein
MNLPIAHHGLVTALPFVAPALIIVAGLLWLALRERLGKGPSAR